jgi:hypothetical protein
LACISRSIRPPWGLDGNEAVDELERHQANSREWLCHEEKKEFNTEDTESTEFAEKRSGDWRQGLRGRRAGF